MTEMSRTLDAMVGERTGQQMSGETEKVPADLSLDEVNRRLQEHRGDLTPQQKQQRLQLYYSERGHFPECSGCGLGNSYRHSKSCKMCQLKWEDLKAGELQVELLELERAEIPSALLRLSEDEQEIVAQVAKLRKL